MKFMKEVVIVLISIIILLIVAALAKAVAGCFPTGDKTPMRINLEVIAVGVVAALLYNFAIDNGRGWMILVATTAFIGGLVYQWSKEGSELREFLYFTGLTFIIGGIGLTAAVNVENPVLVVIAIVVPILAIGTYAWMALSFHRDRVDNEDDEKKYTGWRTAVAALTVLLVVGSLFSAYAISGGEFNLGQMADNAAESVSDSMTADASDDGSADKDEDVAANWYFYNADVQGGSEKDDFNFGPKPKGLTAAGYDENFRERLEKDPALGAADMAWADAWLGTRYLGEFYESCHEDWAKTINQAKETWIKNPDEYQETLDAFFQMLNTADVKVTAGNGLEDQMYMNPFTKDGVPDVIVMDSPDHSGKFLTYVFTIKGTKKIKVMYRIDCGYQPTNVEEVMNITPQGTPKRVGTPSNPNKPSKPGNPSNPGRGDNPSKPDKPDKPHKPSYNKDPSKAPSKNTEPNDNKGPGENTNNPSKPDRSTKDTDDSSSNGGGSYQDYKDGVKDKENTNNNQRTGNDSSTPSTPKPKPSTNVDNNGGSANKPTPKKPAETVKDDKPADHMDEPD